VPIEDDVTEDEIEICCGYSSQHDGETDPEIQEWLIEETNLFATTIILTHLKKSTKVILYP
jgi:hypothetical protein